MDVTAQLMIVCTYITFVFKFNFKLHLKKVTAFAYCIITDYPAYSPSPCN